MFVIDNKYFLCIISGSDEKRYKMIKNYKIKKYLVLLKMSFKSYEKLYSLKSKFSAISDVLFIDRLQPSKGFFKAKAQDYIEPKDWKNTDPCKVTVFRNGYEDWMFDEIFNVGSDADVKEFCCPHFKENKPCMQNCRYVHQYNEYLELNNKLIPNAEKTHGLLVAKRKAAWQQIFANRTK